MVDHHPVAALHARNRGRAGGADGDVGHPVAKPRHPARRGGQHRHARALLGHVQQPDVDAAVVLIGPCPAAVVLRAGPGIVVHVLLYLAVAPDLAGQGEAQRRAGRRLDGRRGARKAGQQDENGEPHAANLPWLSVENEALLVETDARQLPQARRVARIEPAQESSVLGSDLRAVVHLPAHVGLTRGRRGAWRQI